MDSHSPENSPCCMQLVVESCRRPDSFCPMDGKLQLWVMESLLTAIQTVTATLMELSCLRR